MRGKRGSLWEAFGPLLRALEEDPEGVLKRVEEVTRKPPPRARPGRRQKAWYHARITACPAGHPYEKENTYVDPQGFRHCRACHRRRQKLYGMRREK